MERRAQRMHPVMKGLLVGGLAGAVLALTFLGLERLMRTAPKETRETTPTPTPAPTPTPTPTADPPQPEVPATVQ